jgi:hypothetical protein
MPNPVVNEVAQISLAGQEGYAIVSIYDGIGKLVSQESIEMIDGEVYKVDFSNTENGVYFLEVLVNGDRKVKKVIVSKQ